MYSKDGRRERPASSHRRADTASACDTHHADYDPHSDDDEALYTYAAPLWTWSQGSLTVQQRYALTTIMDKQREKQGTTVAEKERRCTCLTKVLDIKLLSIAELSSVCNTGGQHTTTSHAKKWNKTVCITKRIGQNVRITGA